jgi:hypothetical protein
MAPASHAKFGAWMRLPSSSDASRSCCCGGVGRRRIRRTSSRKRTCGCRSIFTQGQTVRQPEAFLVRTVLRLHSNASRYDRRPPNIDQAVEELVLLDTSPLPDDVLHAVDVSIGQEAGSHAQRLRCTRSVHARRGGRAVPQCTPRATRTVGARHVSGRRARRSQVSRDDRLCDARGRLVRRALAPVTACGECAVRHDPTAELLAITQPSSGSYQHILG